MLNQMKKAVTVTLLTLVGVFTLAVHPTFAVTAPNYLPNALNNNASSSLANSKTLNDFISGVIDLIFAVAGLLVLVYLILAGIKYVTSGGDAGKTAAARKQIIAALIGLVIVVLAYFLVNLVLEVLGITNGPGSIALPCIKSGGGAGTIQSGVCQ